MIITSASNDRIKGIKKLVKSASERCDRDVYIVEGIRMFREIPVGCIEEVYASETAFEKYKEELLKVISEEELVVVSDKIFSSMSDTNTPQGIMALVKRKHIKLEDVLGTAGTNIEVIESSDVSSEETTFILIIETLQDPGNLGTIIRTSEAAGVTGIVLSSDSVDLYNPKVVRSTMGAVFRLPVYVSEDLTRDIEIIKSKGITVFGAHLDGKDFYSKDLTKACAFLIGNEGNGLSEEISAKADELIRIPMCGKVESLNAAMSAGVISYEVLRQRKFTNK